MHNDLQALSTDEKIRLVEELWQSIETERSKFFTPQQKDLLEKRLLKHDQNPGEGRTWREIRTKYF